MSDAVRQGGCGCGHVRYLLRGEPIFTNNCHCRLCQQQTGSTSVVNAFFEMERITLLTGALRENVVEGGSGKPHTICRCAACGMAVWSYYGRLGRLGAGVRVGTLDDSGSITPDAVIFTASAMPWVAFPEDIPRFAQFYDFAEILPAERLARFGVLLDRRKAGEG
jgi:hypothetical protein